jgi:hypothetical protein
MHDLLNPLIADNRPKLIEGAPRENGWKIDNGGGVFGRDLNKFDSLSADALVM